MAFNAKTMFGLKNHMLGLALFIEIITLSTSKPATAQSNISDSFSDSTHLTEIQWLNNELGIGNLLEVSRTYPRTDDESFQFGLECKKPGFAVKQEKYEPLLQFVEEAYSGFYKKELESCCTDSNFYTKITYDYFVHDSILSLLVTDAQVYFQSEILTTYKLIHFDFKNQRELLTEDMFEAFGLSRIPVLNAIVEQCVWPDESKEPLFDTQWFEKIKWLDLNQLKMYIDNNLGINVIYPLIESGIEQKTTLQ